MLFFTLPSLTFTPRRYRPRGVGNWSGHIPFACDLIAWLRPAVVVELGTHLGESYFAFCQAIVESGTQAKAYAVDTWQGDLHTGAYGEEVFGEVDCYNRKHYGRFSELLRMLFDEAVGQFKDESIDLLHIDGMHTYEAVRHDFDTWWPKVRPGGVVLLHDSFARHGDFGVWKLLGDLRRGVLETAEFVHSNGLAIILKPGERPEGGVIPLLSGGDEALKKGVRHYYEVCADHLEQRFWAARRERPADWDLTTQLFWRPEGESFREESSIRVAHTVTAENSRIALTIPPLAVPVAELRLDVCDIPAFVALHSISVIQHGEPLWSMEATEHIDELRSAGLHCARGSGGALVFDAPAGASVLLPITRAILERLQNGATIAVTLNGVDAVSAVSQIRSASEGETAELTRAVGNYERALREAQQLCETRLAENSELTRSVGNYERALHEAQQLCETRLAENSELTRSLANYERALREAQQLCESRLTESAELTRSLRNCDRALGEAQQLCESRLTELHHYSEALARAEQVSWERLAEVERYELALRETQRLASERQTELEATTQHVGKLEAELQLRRVELETVRADLAERERQAAELRNRLGAIESSRAWRLLKSFSGKP